MRPTIAIDFDGKICGYAFPACGPPRETTIAMLRRLKAEGWWIIIHSSRVNREWPAAERLRSINAMISYLLQHDIPFDQVWGLAFPLGVAGSHAFVWVDPPDCGGKPVAHVYDDDRGLGDDELEGRSVDDLVARCRLLYHRGERQF